MFNPYVIIKRLVKKLVALLNEWVNEGSNKPYFVNSETQLCILDLRNTDKIYVLINCREILYYEDFVLVTRDYIDHFYNYQPFYFMYSRSYLKKIDAENIAYMIYNRYIN